MVIAICERLDDVLHDVDAAHAQLVVSLEPKDAGRGFGYARLGIGPVTRLDGVAVVVGDASMAGVPDPIVVLVRDEPGGPPAATLSVRRAALPLLVRADPVAGTAAVIRRLGRPSKVEERVAPEEAPTVPPPVETPPRTPARLGNPKTPTPTRKTKTDLPDSFDPIVDPTKPR